MGDEADYEACCGPVGDDYVGVFEMGVIPAGRTGIGFTGEGVDGVDCGA